MLNARLRFDLIRQCAETDHAQYPQYQHHWSGPEWRLGRVSHTYATQAGVSFLAGDYTIYRPNPMFADLTAYSTRTKMDTRIPEAFVEPIPSRNSYHFDLGNSTEGPIGYCARVVAESPEEACEILRDRIDKLFSCARVWGEGEDEYIEVYFGLPRTISEEAIDDWEPLEYHEKPPLPGEHPEYLPGPDPELWVDDEGKSRQWRFTQNLADLQRGIYPSRSIPQLRIFDEYVSRTQ